MSGGAAGSSAGGGASAGKGGAAAAGGRTPAAPDPACPFCKGRRTELASAFGSHASLSTWWCAECRSPFEVLRWREKEGPGLGRSGPDQPSSKSTSA